MGDHCQQATCACVCVCVSVEVGGGGTERERCSKESPFSAPKKIISVDPARFSSIQSKCLIPMNRPINSHTADPIRIKPSDLLSI